MSAQSTQRGNGYPALLRRANPCFERIGLRQLDEFHIDEAHSFDQLCHRVGERGSPSITNAADAWWGRDRNTGCASTE
jgi:hypothetical protein